MTKIKLSSLKDKKDLGNLEMQEYLHINKIKTVVNDLPSQPPYIEYNPDDLLKVWDILKGFL